MIYHDPDWYVQNGFNYLVFSNGIFGRLYDDPEKYNAQIVQYDAFFNRFKLIKKFSDGSLDILVYQLN
jgi:hypothetical protein